MQQHAPQHEFVLIATVPCHVKHHGPHGNERSKKEEQAPALGCPREHCCGDMMRGPAVGGCVVGGLRGLQTHGLHWTDMKMGCPEAEGDKG